MEHSLSSAGYNPTSPSGYREFRQELKRQSRASGDQALVSLDLLLPAEGGWPNSPTYLSEVDMLKQFGVNLGQLSDSYVLKYLRYIEVL